MFQKLLSAFYVVNKTNYKFKTLLQIFKNGFNHKLLLFSFTDLQKRENLKSNQNEFQSLHWRLQSRHFRADGRLRRRQLKSASPVQARIRY